MRRPEGSRPAWRLLRLGFAGAFFLAAVLVSFWVLHIQFGDTSLANVQAAMREQTAWHVLGALALTGASFSALAINELLGIRAVVPGRVPAGAGLLAGSTANSLSNTLGFPALTGSVVRARIYLKFGLSVTEVARIVSFSWLALALGVATVLAGAQLLRALAGAGGGLALLLGLALTAALALFLAWLARAGRQVTILGFRQPLPSARVALVLMASGALETASAFGALYVLLPPDLAPPFGPFAVGCIVAVSLGVAAHVPGGVGVFEAAVTAMVSGAGRADLLSALLLYRLVYNLLPFIVSLAALGAFFHGRRRTKPRREELRG